MSVGASPFLRQCFRRRRPGELAVRLNVELQLTMDEQTGKPEYIVPTLNEHGMTEFHMSAYHGDLRWIQDCLARGLDTEVRDLGGNTPLHWAADMAMVDGEREEVAKSLISGGSDVNALRSGGVSVLMVAVSAGNLNVICQLLKAGADLETRDDKGDTARDYTSSPKMRAALGFTPPAI